MDWINKLGKKAYAALIAAVIIIPITINLYFYFDAAIGCEGEIARALIGYVCVEGGKQ